MSKRARYTGGSGTGVDVRVDLGNAHHVSVHVDPNHLFPDEVDVNGESVPVPANTVDRLLEQVDAWTAVEPSTKDKG